MKMHKFYCDANTGIEIRGRRVYSQICAGDSWYDDALLGTTPMPEWQARNIVDAHLRFCDAPERASALGALTGRHFAASES